MHSFYDQLCPDCGDFNFAKRAESADLRGRVALLTGGRVKIGYQAGIKLLRAGAQVIVTTRFPRDAAARYAAEAGLREWGDRLEIFGLDLRHTPSVEAFCRISPRPAPPRLHRQQRLSDRAPAARVLPPHDGPRAASADGCPRTSGDCSGVRGLRRTDAAPALADGAPDAAELSRLALLTRGRADQVNSSPRAGSTRTCSRSTSASGTRGGCHSRKSRPLSCSRPSSSTPWPRSSSTPPTQSSAGRATASRCCCTTTGTSGRCRSTAAPAVNLTVNGRKDQIRYQRRFALEPPQERDKGIDLDEAACTSRAYGEWTKKAGIARVEPGQARRGDAEVGATRRSRGLMKAQGRRPVRLHARRPSPSRPTTTSPTRRWRTGRAPDRSAAAGRGVPWTGRRRCSSTTRATRATSCRRRSSCPPNYEKGKSYPTDRQLLREDVADARTRSRIRRRTASTARSTRATATPCCCPTSPTR